jgi:serine/threonine protein kinase
MALGDDGELKQEKAVKILQLRQEDKTEEQNAKLVSAAKKESIVWEALGAHPNCVRLYETMYSDDFAFMVMEKCSSSLLSHLERQPDLNERVYGKIFAQMLTGIAHCHSLFVIHRDVKPDNFLVGGQNGQTIKLADFGLSTQMKAKHGGVSGVFGTAPFMCPEMLSGMRYSEKMDVWSFAVMVYVLLFGLFPYMPAKQNSKAMKQAIVEGGVPSFKPTKKHNDLPGFRYSDDALSFVQALLERVPEQRPSAQDALSLPWLQNAQQGCHEPSLELPSLRPLLYASKKVGAFEARDPATVSTVDNQLNAIQMERHGIPLAGLSETEMKDWKVKASISSGTSHTTIASKDAWERDSIGTNSTQQPGSSAPSCSRPGSVDDSSDRGASFVSGRLDVPQIVVQQA